MKSPQLTLLMPVYNAEEFLDQAVQSLQNQKYQNWKLIIINDGSTDSSAQVCDSYAKIDPRIQVIHQENNGVAETRNRLLNQIDTPYFSFVDADDELDSTLYEVLMSHMLTMDVDLVMCGYKEQKRSHEVVIQEIERTYQSGIFELDQMQETFMTFSNTLTLNPLWNKVYKTSIFKELGIVFPKLETGEDIVFNLNYLKGCQKIYMEEKTLYSYIRRQKESITTSYVENLYEKGLVVHEALESFLQSKELLNTVNEEILMKNHVMGVFSAFFNMVHSNCLLDKVEKRQAILAITNRSYVQQCANRHLTTRGIIGLTAHLIRFNQPTVILFIMAIIKQGKEVKRRCQSRLVS